MKSFYFIYESMRGRIKEVLQNIGKPSKKLLIKMLFGTILFLSLGNTMSAVSAADQASPPPKTALEMSTENLISRGNLFQLFSSIIYVLLRPLIALAGLAMDNQLIYGSFMHLDTSLWSIWQIMRNFANYALGLIFLIGILLYNFSPKGKIEIGSFTKGISSPKDLITKTLVASVLIQASRFILMAAIDVSTILTYSVGAIPTSIISTADQKGHDARMLSMNTLLNFGDAGIQKDKLVDEVIINYRTIKKENKDKKYIAPCKTTEVGTGTEGQKFIIGRAFESLTGTDEKGKPKSLKMEPGYCAHYGALISFSEFERTPKAKETNFRQRMKDFEKDVKNSNETQLKDFVKGGMIYPITSGLIPLTSEKVSPTTVEGFKSDDQSYGYKSTELACEEFGFVSPKAKTDTKGKNSEYYCLYNDTDISVSTIIEKGKSMTGPFVALYSSVLSFADLKAYTELGTWQLFIVSLINLIFGGLLILPLCALVIVLFARIGILWVAIATSPFIVLLRVFNGEDGGGILPKWLSLKELQKLLLAPVLISFAVSLSLVFMTNLKNTIGTGEKNLITTGKKETQEMLNKVSGLKVDDDGSIGILGFIKINFDNGLINLAWIITMLFGIGITWFLLFWAIKQTTIGQSIGKGLQSFGERWLATRPLIPIGPKGLSFNSIKDIADPNKGILGKTVQQMESKNVGLVDSLFNKNTPPNETPPAPPAPTPKQMETFFAEGTSPNFSTHFGIAAGDTGKYLNTLDKVWEYHGGQNGLNDEVNKLQKDRLQRATQEYWKTLTDEATKFQDDPEQKETKSYKIKNDILSFLKNENIKKSNFIDTLKNQPIRIGNKSYRIVEKNGSFELEIQG